MKSLHDQRFVWPRPLCVVLLLIGLLWGTVAFAQKSATSDFEAGMKAYQAKDWPAAIVAWQKAYRAKRVPILLYNLTAASLRAGRLEQAERYANKALASEELAKSYKFKTRVLLLTLGRMRKARQVAASTSYEQQRRAKLKKRAEEAARPRYRLEQQRLGWPTYVAAPVALLGFGALFFSARDGAHVAEGIEQGIQREQQREELLERQGRGRVLFYVGSSLTVAALGLFVFDVLTLEERRVRIQAAGAPGKGAQLVLQLVF